MLRKSSRLVAAIGASGVVVLAGTATAAAAPPVVTNHSECWTDPGAAVYCISSHNKSQTVETGSGNTVLNWQSDYTYSVDYLLPGWDSYDGSSAGSERGHVLLKDGQSHVIVYRQTLSTTNSGTTCTSAYKIVEVDGVVRAQTDGGSCTVG